MSQRQFTASGDTMRKALTVCIHRLLKLTCAVAMTAAIAFPAHAVPTLTPVGGTNFQISFAPITFQVTTAGDIVSSFSSILLIRHSR